MGEVTVVANVTASLVFSISSKARIVGREKKGLDQFVMPNTDEFIFFVCFS